MEIARVGVIGRVQGRQLGQERPRVLGVRMQCEAIDASDGELADSQFSPLSE